MADPKYANLPGIDVDSPDVFESNDLPEDDQQIAKKQETNDCVEKINVSTDAAFKAFKGKTAGIAKADFSDSVGKSRNIGYYSEKPEYELAEDGSTTETPSQKYQRLQHEMRELAEEVGKIKENVKGAGEDTVSPVDLGKHLEYLQHQLADLHLEKLLGPNANLDMADPQGALRQRLSKHLESFSSVPTDSNKTKGATSDAVAGHVSYELYYRPEQAKFSKNAKLASLEERLDRLENIMGRNQEKMTLLSADTDNKSLLGAVSTLNSKLSLLDASNTETVEARLNAVLQKMQQIAEKKEKEPQADPDKQKKISELYDLVQKWETTADVLPQVVERLMSLKELHEQALQFSQALSYLDTAQQEVKSSISAHNDMLKELKTSMAENSNTIQQNVESIEKRLNALKK